MLTSLQAVRRRVCPGEKVFLSHWNIHHADPLHCSPAKHPSNSAISRNALDLFHGELTGEKPISSYQSNRKLRVSSCTPNQDRSCSEMCLGVVPVSLFPSRFSSCSAGQAGRNQPPMMAPSLVPQPTGREVGSLGVNMAAHAAPGGTKTSRGFVNRRTEHAARGWCDTRRSGYRLHVDAAGGSLACRSRKTGWRKRGGMPDWFFLTRRYEKVTLINAA